MSYLLPQLWLCLSIATLLGGLMGWFLRGDNHKKLSQIETRWQTRFSDLEYNNQFLLKQLKNYKALERKNKSLALQLTRMKKAAELSSLQLKTQNHFVEDLKQKLNISPDDEQLKDPIMVKPSNAETSEKLNNLQKQQAELDKIKHEKEELLRQVDHFKAELIDTQSKLQVTSEMLEKLQNKH